MMHSALASNLAKNLVIERTFKNGSKYKIEFNIYSSPYKPVSIPVIEVYFQKIYNFDDDNLSILNFAADEVVRYLNKNNCLIMLYHRKTSIKKSKNNKRLLNQKYRSKLFNALYVKYKFNCSQSSKKVDIKNRNIVLHDELYGDHYITFFYKEENLLELEKHCRMFE